MLGRPSLLGGVFAAPSMSLLLDTGLLFDTGLRVGTGPGVLGGFFAALSMSLPMDTGVLGGLFAALSLGLSGAASADEGSAYTLHGIASRLGYSPKERYAGHIQRLSARELERRLRSVGLVPRAWRWSGHLFMQVVDLAYFSLLALRGRNVNTTVEAIVDRSRGIRGAALGVAVRAVAGLGYAESRIMRKAPALGAHVTCVRA